MKKFLAIVMASVMLISSTGVLAANITAPTHPELPESGVIFQEDFSYETTDIVTTLKSNGAAAAYGLTHSNIDDAHGDSITLLAKPASSYQYSNYAAGYGKVDIDSGKLRISQSLYLPSEGELPELTATSGANGFYRIGMNTQTTAETATRNYHWALHLVNNTVSPALTTPTIYFSKSLRDGSYPGPAQSENDVASITLDYDEWYMIETIIDYNSKKISYYINGNKVCDNTATATQFAKYAPVTLVSIYSDANTDIVEASTKKVSFDDFSMEIVDDTMNAEVIETNGDYADVKFSYGISDDGLNTGDVTLKKAGTEEILGIEAIEKIAGDTLRVYTQADIEEGVPYEFIINKDFVAAFDENVKLEAGTPIFFISDVKNINAELLNYTFDTQADLDKIIADGKLSLSYAKSKSTELTVADKDYNTEWLKENVYIEDGYLVFSYDQKTNPMQSLRFDFNGEAKEGKLDVEFDYAITDLRWTDTTDKAGSARAYIALNDKNLSETVTNETGKKVVAKLTEAETIFENYAIGTYATTFLYGLSTEKVYYRWHDPRSDVPRYRTHVSGAKYYDTANATLMPYKMEIDLDNDRFDFYRDTGKDGVSAADLKASYEYLPGGINNGIYDAFVLGADWYTGTAYDDYMYFKLDDLKVTNIVEYNKITDIKFVDFSGNEYSYSSILPAETREIKIEFSSEVAASAAQNAIYVDNGTVEVSGNVATVTFENCLDANANYVLMIDADVAGLKNDIELTFTADAGYISYSSPVIKINGNDANEVSAIAENDTISAEVTVINTSAEDASCFMTLATYQGGYLTSVIPLDYTLGADETYEDIAEIETTATEDYINAEQIKAFIFNNTTQIRPLAVFDEWVRNDK